MIEKTEANEKVNSGWLRVWFMFEAMAINLETAEEALKTHFQKLDSDERLLVYKKDELEGKKVENPPIKGQTEAWSKVIEVEFTTKDFYELISIVMEYGPSAAEIINPNEIKMTLNQSQNVINLVAEMMHRFAAAGIGGIVLPRAGGK